ncbi:MAG: alpha/beta fold hydrolase [Acidimicrobiales bacterium]
MAFAHNGDVEIYYETFGDPGRPALLLVNGLGSQCINYRVEWCESFASAGYFVIRYDNRDVGLSTKFGDEMPDVAAVARSVAEGDFADVPYLLTDMASDGLAVLDDLGIERAHVMGLSMGGMIVQTMAIEHPERLLTVTSMMSTTGDPDVGQSTEEARRLLLTPPASDRDGYIAGSLAGLRIWGSPACFDEERLVANAGEAFDRSNFPSGRVRQLIAIMASGSRTAALRNVSVPTLVLHGSADTLIDPSGGRRTAEVIPGARLELLEGMGHDYPPQYWEPIVELVTAHAAQVPVES